MFGHRSEADGASSHLSLAVLENPCNPFRFAHISAQRENWVAHLENGSKNSKRIECLLPRILTGALIAVLTCSLIDVCLVRRLVLIMQHFKFLLCRRVRLLVKEVEVARQRENARNSKDLLVASLREGRTSILLVRVLFCDSSEARALGAVCRSFSLLRIHLPGREGLRRPAREQLSCERDAFDLAPRFVKHLTRGVIDQVRTGLLLTRRPVQTNPALAGNGFGQSVFIFCAHLNSY